MSPSQGRVALYARISLDRQDGEGVARQVADCRELAAARWPDAEIVEYIDNDISAFRRKKRPRFDDLVADLHAGRVNVVVAYHADRLYRQLTDLERLVAAVKVAGAEVVTIKAGDVDVSTATGQMIAEILASVAKQEAARIGERVSRAKRERAAQGRPAGGGQRPYGLNAERTALVDSEAAALRDAAARVLQGESWGQVVDRMNTAGVRTATGGRWNVSTLRRTLTSPHVAGKRAYKGEVVGPAAWPAILDEDTWAVLRADAQGRRRGRPPSDRWLLTGLLSCSSCGRPLWANGTRGGGYAYRCTPARGDGCGKISIAVARADKHVIKTVAGWLDDEQLIAELDAWLTWGDASASDAKAELDDIARRQAQLDQRWAAGDIEDDRYYPADAILSRRRTEVEARIAGAPRIGNVHLTGADLRAVFLGGSHVEQREVIGIVAAAPIEVRAGRTADGHIVPVESRIRLVPVWAADVG